MKPPRSQIPVAHADSRASVRYGAATAFALLAVCASGAGAQSAVAVGQGDRVRITSERTSGDFVVTSVLSEALLLGGEPQIEVPIASLSELHVQRGREISTGEGLFGGGAVGAVVGLVLGLQDIQTHYASLTRMSMKESVVLGVGLGSLIGLFVSRRSDEVWQQVALPHLPNGRPREATREFAAREAEPVIVGVPDLASTELVELIVRNRSPEPVNAFAWWEGGARVSLGMVRANSTTAFITARRSAGVMLIVNPVSSPGPPRGPSPRPSEFIVVGLDERLEWVVLNPSGVVQDYLRLTPR